MPDYLRIPQVKTMRTVATGKQSHGGKLCNSQFRIGKEALKPLR